MPIFSNLSRRLHMLTTDAKPDPPRIPIKEYTHNFEPNTVKNETTKSNFERNNVTTCEKTKSLSNDAVPDTDPNSSTKEHDLNNTNTTSPPEAKERRKSNVKTKMKSKQHKYSQGTRVVNYNIINSNDVKIGSRTSYICNINQFAKNNDQASEEQWTKSKIRQMPLEVERLSVCADEITLDDIFVIKTSIGYGWKDVARKLLYSEGQIEQFEENYRFRGISEVIYQILLDWKQANTKNADIGNLISILWDCKEYDCVERLVSIRKKSI